MYSLLKRFPRALMVIFCVGSGLFAQTASAASQPYRTQQAHGIIVFDYENIPVPGEQSIDLLGLHYLHQVNDWFFLGVGAHAPLFHGEFGGFMTFDVTAHIRKRLLGNIFIDAGSSLGGGGGGSSIEQSKLLSGSGGYNKNYVGLAYQFRTFGLGVGYTKFHFYGSLIDHSQISFYFQKPISFSVGPYFGSDEKFTNLDGAFCDNGCSGTLKSKVSVEFNNMLQINPQGSYKDTINLLSFQYSHFINDNAFVFMEADAGVHGLPLYNQLIGGVGYQRNLSESFSFIGQLGIGSGGYAPAEVDTGAGVLVYPKFGLEYLASRNVGFALTGGYLVAPKGTSKNATVGLAMNYYLSGQGRESTHSTQLDESTARNIRINLFEQTKLNPKIKGEDHDDIHMITAQFDYVAHDYVYFPIQISFAYNEYRDYPGYGEIMLGFGLQTKTSATNRFQFFIQTLAGANATGVIVKPEIGVNYALSEHFALYGQAGASRSIDSVNRHTMRAYNVGFGLSYRFSMPD